MDERPQNLEQGPPAGADPDDQPRPRLPEPPAGAPPSEGMAEPCRSTPFAPPEYLPRAAGGGAGGVVALVLLASELTRGEVASPFPAPPALPTELESPREPEEPAAIVEPPIELSPSRGELASDCAPPPEAPELEALAELPGPVEAAAVPVLIEEIPADVFRPLPIPVPAPEAVPVLRPIGPELDLHAEAGGEQSLLPELPDAPHIGEPAVTQPDLSDVTASDLTSQPEAPEPEIAPPTVRTGPRLLDQIPLVPPGRPEHAVRPPPIARVLQWIEPGHVPRAAPQLQLSPPVVLPAEDDRIVAPSPLVALPLPSRVPTRTLGRRLHLALVAALAVVAVLVAMVLALATLYRWVDPPMSTLMLGQRLAGMPVNQRWVPLERISPSLGAAVIQSEDGHFCRHHGVDWGELKEAIESAGDGLARGGSTITMQVVKNLFLWPSRSYLRKAIEIPLAFVIEGLWPKRRILEIYLNIAEWGPGVFGAEAAARYHFRKPALLLTPREAALLAVSLPNPIERQAGRPGQGTQRLADNLQLRMRAASANTRCLRATSSRG